MTSSTIAWTADDWGLSPGVNAGILDLARLGVVRRVSMMATCEHLREGLPELLGTSVETGLHFNLSYGRPLEKHQHLVDAQGVLHSPSKLFFLWSFSKQREELAREVLVELRAQMRRLVDQGIPLRYLDSHHHTHLLPGLIEKMAPTLSEFGVNTVRLPLDKRLRWTAQAPVYWLARWNKSSFKKLGIRSLPFAYPAMKDLLHPEKLTQRAQQMGGLEAIVHPAKRMDFEELNIPDSYRSGRLVEFEVLKSFAELTA